MTNEERQQAIEWLKRRPVMMAGAKRMYNLAIEALEQPEIIHCKDCKYWKEKPLYTYCERMYHMGFVEFLDYMVEENDFCSWAERKEEAE